VVGETDGQPSLDRSSRSSSVPPEPTCGEEERREFDLAVWDTGKSEPRGLPFRFLALLSDPVDASGWFGANAAGCILETSTVAELVDAVHQVARGGIFVAPELVKQIVSPFPFVAGQHTSGIERLTEREEEVLAVLGQGLSNREIAPRLYLSVCTVEKHLESIYGNLHVRTRTEAAVLAVQRVAKVSP
jgi:DNA-binding NarL/FixJ family response regulator